MAEYGRTARRRQVKGVWGPSPMWVIVCLAASVLAACQSGPAASDGTGLTKGLAGDSTDAVAGQDGLRFAEAGGLECNADPASLFDLAAAANTPTLLADLEVGTLGEDGAAQMANDLASLDGSFCGADLLPETQAVLDEAQQLADGGRTDEALSLLEGHVAELLSAAQGGWKLAAPFRDHAEGERRKIRSLLAMAGRAQLYGPPGSDIDFFEAANETFEAMAEQDLPNASARDALLIAMEAQLLGLEEVATDALERATSVLEMELQAALGGFDPCTANEDAIQDLLLRIARVQATGGDTVLAVTAVEQFEAARRVLSRRARGEEVTECGEPMAFEWSQGHDFGWVSTGSAWTCDGKNWHVDVTMEVTVAGGFVEESGMLDFEVVDGTSGEIVIPNAGILTETTSGLSQTAAVNDPLNFRLTLDEDGLSGLVSLSGTGTGTITYSGGEVEDWGSVRPGGPEIAVTLMPYEGCQ